MHPDWARSLRDQCAEAGIKFLFKQFGNWTPKKPDLMCKMMVCMHPSGHHYEADKPDQWQTHTCLYNVGKKAAGRELDGRTHDEYPEAAELVS